MPGEAAIRDGGRPRCRHFLAEHHVRALNVAGPRASQEPGVANFVGQVLAAVCAARKRPEFVTIRPVVNLGEADPPSAGSSVCRDSAAGYNNIGADAVVTAIHNLPGGPQFPATPPAGARVASIAQRVSETRACRSRTREGDL